MTSPGKLLSPIWAGAAHTIDKALGTGTTPATPSINIPAPPAPIAPATSPNAKPAKKGMQSSFLSGVAGAGLTPGAGSSTGKTLLGQ